MASVTFPPSLGGDGSTVTDDSNPVTGLGNGGHRQRLVPALSQTIVCMNSAIAQATAQVAAAAGQVDLAEAEADAAAASAAESADYAATAMQSPGTSATSTSSLAIGTGSKSLTLAQTGKAFVVNQYVQVVTGSGWMLGPITAFNSGTGAITINATHAGGSGTFSAWTITPGSPLNLPSPAGQAGKAMVSNGIDYVLKLQQPTTLISAAGVLPDEGNYTFARDVSVTLPDLTVARNISLTLPSNLQTFASSVVTSDGWTIGMGFSAGVTKTNAPMDWSTPHGWWGSAQMTPPLNSTSSALGSGAMEYKASLILSATCHVYIFAEASTNYYGIAIDPTTGVWGTPVLLFTIGSNYTFAYQVSATSFVVFTNNVAVACSVSGLALTAGSPLTLSGVVYGAPVQLTATTYLVQTGALTNNMSVISVSGTTCSSGTAVTSGITTSQAWRLAPISSTAALLVYAAANSTSTALVARVISVSGTTVTLNAATNAATNAVNGTVSLFCSVMAMSATSFIACAENTTTSTSGSWYGITVSGTTVTIGTVAVQALTKWVNYDRFTYIYRTATIPTSTGINSPLTGAQLDSTRMLGLISQFSTLVAVSISGTTLTFGASYSTGSPAHILTDIATGLNFYANGSATVAKLSISGTTISAAFTIAFQVNTMFSDTLNDKSVNYGGTYFTWTGIVGLAACNLPISANKYASLLSNVLRTYGNFS